ncbi:MAG: Nudix family hydrolase [Gammaproteobacteria bacterium]|nr:Nudix family hydrolase [Gammaproteobacteria bacterium]
MPNTELDTVLHVVVGIITDATGRVLISQRLPNSHEAGKWEFPGGKIEKGETAAEALNREMLEELGIHVRESSPWFRVSHSYPSKQVCLDIWRVFSYEGVVVGMEGQPIQWALRDELSHYKFPDANQPIIRALALPPLYAISAIGHLGINTFLKRLEQALEAGLRLVQLREPQLTPQEYSDAAKQVNELCRRYQAKLLLNADISLLSQVPADGVHLTSKRLAECKILPADRNYLVAASCHDENELAKAEELGVDFVVLSPVLPTQSHPGAKNLGWDAFQALCQYSALPVFALGGMMTGHIKTAQARGAQGIAMIGGLWGAEFPGGVVRRIVSESRY